MRVLAIASHPDDETLGCGGTLLKHRDAGDRLFWLIATPTHQPTWTSEETHIKAAEVETVAQAYGMERRFELGFPTVMLDTVSQSEIIGRIREVFQEVRPDTVYLVHGGDAHGDHRAVFDAAAAVLKPFHLSALGVRRMLCFETLSSTEAASGPWRGSFVPNVLSDITPTWSGS